jgi:hypothetical protein
MLAFVKSHAWKARFYERRVRRHTGRREIPNTPIGTLLPVAPAYRNRLRQIRINRRSKGIKTSLACTRCLVDNDICPWSDSAILFDGEFDSETVDAEAEYRL